MGAGGLFLRKVRAKVSEEPTGFVWIEKGKLAGSGYPASRGQLEWLVARGIGAILTLTEDPLPAGWLEGLPLVSRHVSMKDHGAPDAAKLDEAASFVQSQLAEGKAVVVHCLAGEGRTGCVLAAYLMRYKGTGAQEALSELRKLKPQFVESSQERALTEFESKMRRG